MRLKEKRAKKLTLRDIHVDDWVQVWSPIPERYSPPMKITAIHDDGTIYLTIDDECRCDSWEEDIKNIDALPITIDLLKGFGFQIEEKNYTIHYKDYCIGCISDPKSKYAKPNFYIYGCHCRHMHELTDILYKKIDNIRLEWNGVDKTKEEHEKV